MASSSGQKTLQKIPLWTRMTGMTRMTSPWRVAKIEPFRVVRGLSVSSSELQNIQKTVFLDPNDRHDKNDKKDKPPPVLTPHRRLRIIYLFIFIRAGLGLVIFGIPVIPDIRTPEPLKKSPFGVSRSFFLASSSGLQKSLQKIPFWTRMTGMTRMTRMTSLRLARK